MQLSKFSYKEYQNSDRSWTLEKFELGDINLIVGNNSSGKTRTLNVIHGLARALLNPTSQYNSGLYSACFKNDKSNLEYTIEFENGIVKSERLMKDEGLLIERDSSGKGQIFNENLNALIDFKIPPNQLVASRRDEIQYPYLEALYKWATTTRHFRFSKQEQTALLLVDSNQPETEPFNDSITNQAISIFRKGKGSYRNQYVNKVLNDFNSIGYEISEISIGNLQSVRINNAGRNQIQGLRVQEKDRIGRTDSSEMSDGMFRALSIIIHYNYYEMKKEKLVVLIDDIGEGLDYERSTNLIKLLIEKSKYGIQLIMSSNDKFVMNNTKLKYWQVISRKGGVVSMKNHINSPEIFNKFKFTGLNNFDFFTTDFFKTGEQQ